MTTRRCSAPTWGCEAQEARAADEGKSGLRLELNGAVATLRLRHPREANRIAPEDPDVVWQRLRRIADAPPMRVLVLTGTGPRTFGSG